MQAKKLYLYVCVQSRKLVRAVMERNISNDTNKLKNGCSTKRELGAAQFCSMLWPVKRN